MNNSINNEKKITGMISEISSIPFLFPLTLPTDTEFPFFKNRKRFSWNRSGTFFLARRTFLHNHFIII